MSTASPGVRWPWRRVQRHCDRVRPGEEGKELHEQRLESCIGERLARINGTHPDLPVDYQRTLATDDKVLRELVDELALRLPRHARRRVVLLAERNSLYAQVLVAELRYRLTDRRSAQYDPDLRLAYTRNLVVASSLPLAFADPQLQAGAPPFRDVHQTALFLAARQAACRAGPACEQLRDGVRRAIDAPSLYEIGRQQAVPLSGYDHGQRVRNQHVAHTGIALPLWLVLAGALLFWPSTPALRAVRAWLFGQAQRAGPPPRLATALLAVLHLSLLGFTLGNAVEFAAPGRLGLVGILLLTALGICAYLAWLVVLAVLLKRAAERARDKALQRMHADLRWLGGAGPDWQPLVEPFRRLVDEVRANQDGAFAPLFEQPLFKGLMVPLGGIGSTQLFDYLLLAR